VPIGSMTSRLLYAIKFGEPNILLSSAVNRSSRLLYVRDPLARVAKVAPFLTLDGDGDPVLRTWMKVFPGLIKPRAAIPASLLAHLRYPQDLFAIQREVLASYHVQAASAFYGGQDFWDVPAGPTGAAPGTGPQPPAYGFLYVEPMYVEASAAGNAGAYPTLQAVLASYGGRAGFGKTLPDALGQVFTGLASSGASSGRTAAGAAGGGSAPVRAAIAQAEQSFAAAQNALKNGNFTAYGQDIAAMKKALDTAQQAVAAK
jgi:uncharacterized membrane protein (UPF0182 family)